MRYIESTKNLITVGNSVGITLGTEAAKMGKEVRDEIGVIVFEPDLLDEAVSRLKQDGRNRYFISVHLDGGLIENDMVYGRSARSIRSEDGDCLTILGPFDSLRSCIKFKLRFEKDPPKKTADAYQETYTEFVTD